MTKGVARSFHGHFISASLWRYQDILRFSFIPPNVSGKPFGLLILVTRTRVVLLGVPDSISRSEIVEFFQGHGVREAND